MLTSDTLKPSESNKKVVAIFYPWGDILDSNSGAAKRTGLLINFLKDYNQKIKEVIVFSPSHESKVVKKDNVTYIFHKLRIRYYALPLIFYAFVKLFLLTVTLGKSNGREWILKEYFKFSFDYSFRKKIRDIAIQSDLIILEYPFWAKIVRNNAPDKNIVLTSHDVIANQVNDINFLHKFLINLEVESLKKADHLFCVSEQDRQYFKQYGLNMTTLLHGVDNTRHSTLISQLSPFAQGILINNDLEDSLILEEINQLGNICLFVGSGHLPNKIAVLEIKKMAKQCEEDHYVCNNSLINFVVVGGCHPKEKSRNFSSLGMISESLLDLIYQSASLIIVPLLSGTGASIKTIEAMAYGKAILGTSVCFRGYPVVSGENCIVSDDLTTYPSMIYNLLGDPVLIQSLETNAKIFAERYDYRKIYEAYLSFF